MTEPSAELIQGNNTSDDSSDAEFDAIYDNPAVKVLRGFEDVTKETIHKILDHGIEYKDLPALCDQDLELFGIENQKTRTEMIRVFSKIKFQEEHLDKYLKEIDLDSYRETVYRNARDQLQRIQLLLEMVQCKLSYDPIEHNSLITHNQYTSELNVKTLKSILQVVRREKKEKSKTGVYCTASIAVMAVLGCSFAIIKQFA